MAAPVSAQVFSSVTRSIVAEFYRSDDSDRDIHVFALGADGGWRIVAWLSLHGTASLIATSGSRTLEDSTPPLDLNANALGSRFLGSARLSPLRIGPLVPYLEAGAGILFTTREFPPGGTMWNFTRRFGGGMATRLGDRIWLLAALFTTHVSNGKGFGHPRNPSFDGTGVLIGISRWPSVK